MNTLLFCLRDFLLFPIDRIKSIYLSKAYQLHLPLLFMYGHLTFIFVYAAPFMWSVFPAPLGYPFDSLFPLYSFSDMSKLS